MKCKQLTVLLLGVVAGMAYAAPATTSAQNKNTSAPAATQTQTTASPDLSTDKSKISYTLGVDMGRNLKAQNLTMDPKLFAQGITDGLAGGPYLMTDKQMNDAIEAFKQVLYTKQAENRKQVEAQQKQAGEQNAKAGNDFLAQNKTKPGVQTMSDGLQYRSITTGTGATPTANDMVTVDYEGRLLDGTVFDSSYRQGQPVTFKVSEVITGWQEALTHMKVGDVWEVYIPPQLAYGSQGVGGPIGPNQTLIFKIHLIDIKKPTSAANTNNNSSSNKAATSNNVSSSKAVSAKKG